MMSFTRDVIDIMLSVTNRAVSDIHSNSVTQILIPSVYTPSIHSSNSSSSALSSPRHDKMMDV